MGLCGKKNRPVGSTLLSPTLVNLVLGVDLLRSWCYKGFHTGSISDSAPVVSSAIGVKGDSPTSGPSLFHLKSAAWVGCRSRPSHFFPRFCRSLCLRALPFQGNNCLQDSLDAFLSRIRCFVASASYLNQERTKTSPHMGPFLQGREGKSPLITQR